MSEPLYWFLSKRYSWGWGVPTRWQGWVVLAVHFALVVAVVFAIRPEREPVRFVLALSGLSIVLVAICWLTGEPPRWRWGSKQR
jgi:hypothetical protein